MNLFHIEVDRGFPKKKRELIYEYGRRARVFRNREAARQYIRNHNLTSKNPKIVQATIGTLTRPQARDAQPE